MTQVHSSDAHPPALPLLVSLAVDSQEALMREVTAVLGQLASESGSALQPWARRINGRQGTGPVRLALTAQTLADLRRKLTLVKSTSQQGGDTGFLHGMGIFLNASGRRAGKVALLFPGQGGQYAGMLGELGQVYPEVRRSLAEGDACFERIAGRPLSTTFRATAGQEELEQEESTIHAAVMLVNHTLFQLMRSCGITPDFLLGQSAGEYATLVASGMWTLASGLQAIYQRTLRVLEVPAASGGGMASVACAAGKLRALADGLPGWVGLASDNCPSRVTISGERHALEALRTRCEAESIEYIPLPVSHGYHSHLIRAAVKSLQQDLRGIPVSAPKLRTISSVDGQEYCPEVTSEFMAHHLARQLVIPVEFSHHIRHLHDEGVELFLESGPRASLTAFTGQTLGARQQHISCASIHPKVGEVEQFHRLLACAYAHHHLQPSGLKAFALDAAAEMAVEVKARPELATTEPFSHQQVQAILVSALARRAGFPEFLLELDLDLEVDLGIDTIKQTDALAQVVRHFGIRLPTTFRIRNHNTLRKLIDALVRLAPGEGLPAPTPSTPPAVVATPVRPPAPVPAPAPTSAPAVNEPEVRAFLVSALVEKTGYPVELLEPDLDLERDLGVDTVKQVDVLAQAFGRFGAAADKKLRIRDYNTLRKMASLVVSRASTHAPAPTPSTPPAVVAAPVRPPAPAPVPTSAPAVNESEVRAFLVSALVEKTGYPVELLEPDLDLERDLGVDTVKQVDVLAQAFGRFGAAADKKLRIRDYNTLRKMASLVVSRASTHAPAIPAASLREQEQRTSATARPRVLEADVQAFIQKALSERTGYPEAVLGIDLDVESDLGIDTVKQRDVLRQACERFGLQPPPLSQLRAYNTIRKLVAFVLERTSEGTPVAATTATKAHATAPSSTRIRYEIPSVRGGWQASRFCLEALTQPLDATSTERFRFAGKTLALTFDPYGIARLLHARLEAAGARVLSLVPENFAGPCPADAHRVDFAQPDRVRALLHQLQTKAPIDGVFHLHPLTPEPAFTQLLDTDWERMVDQATVGALGLVQPLYNHFESAAPGETFLVVTTQMRGCLGVKTGAPLNPVCGGWAGFLKSLRRELPGTLTKVVDFDELYPAEQIAQKLMDEVAALNPQVECGYIDGKRHVLVPVRRERPTGSKPLEVGADWVFIVSGGGRGVVAEVIKQLVKQFGCTVYITGRTPLPDPSTLRLELSDAALRTTGRAAYFSDLLRATPNLTITQLRQSLDELLRARELHRNLQELHGISSRVHYRSCDITRRAQVEQLVQEIRQTHGRIDAVIHGAMVEESKSLPMKTDELYRRTVATKVHGAYYLMRSTLQDKLRLFMNFGSGAGRFGNKGQTDYAAAGDLLVKLTHVYQRELSPETRCITIDWPAWKGAGWVANNPDVEGWLKGAALSTFIELDEGVAWFVGEMLFGGDAPEVIVASERMTEALSRSLLATRFSEAYAALSEAQVPAGPEETHPVAQRDSEQRG